MSIGAVIFIWTFAIVFALAPVFNNTVGSSYALHTSHLYCAVAWWNKSTTSLIVVFTALIVIGGTVSFVFFSYYSIVKLYFSLTAMSNPPKSELISDDLESPCPVESIESTPVKRFLTIQGISTDERRLLLKSISICAAFFTAWTPYLLKILIEFATSNPVSGEFDAFCCLCCSTNGSFNAGLLFLFDKRIRKHVLKLLRIKTPVR
jgi:hypothetical protein